MYRLWKASFQTYRYIRDRWTSSDVAPPPASEARSGLGFGSAGRSLVIRGLRDQAAVHSKESQVWWIGPILNQKSQKESNECQSKIWFFWSPLVLVASVRDALPKIDSRMAYSQHWGGLGIQYSPLTSKQHQLWSYYYQHQEFPSKYCPPQSCLTLAVNWKLVHPTWQIGDQYCSPFIVCVALFQCEFFPPKYS